MPVVAGISIIFIASVICGLTGFGFALVSIPLLISVLEPRTVVPVVLLLGKLTQLFILFDGRKTIDLKRIWPLIVAGILATPLGTFFLLILDGDTLKVLIGAMAALSALALFAGYSRPVRNEGAAGVLVGLASGLLNGSTGMGGPPLVLFFSNQARERQTFRTSISLFFILTGVSALLSQWLAGLITRDVLSYVAWFLPALVFGVGIGVKLARQVREVVFRRISLGVVMLTGLSAIASGVGLL